MSPFVLRRREGAVSKDVPRLDRGIRAKKADSPAVAEDEELVGMAVI